MPKRVLAFDIGIKNLAWCCGDIEKKDGTKFTTVKGWSNENLITGGTAETDAIANQCMSCTHKANYWHKATGNAYCSRHCPPLTPALRDLSGNLVKKVPKINILRTLAVNLSTKLDKKVEKGILKTKEKTIEFLEQYYCFPKPPAVQVKKVELEELHDGMQEMVTRNAELFSSCDEILLENQPVFKNPVMKSVQMMLYATLRDLLEGPPKIRLVHASRKTEGATKGDEGYGERKSMSEAKVLEGLKTKKIVISCADGRKPEWFEGQSKRSDLADCLCMVMDSPVGE